MTQREQHIADALYLVRVERDIYRTALEAICDHEKVDWTAPAMFRVAEEALRRG